MDISRLTGIKSGASIEPDWGIKSALWAGVVEPGELPRFVDSPAAALTDAGLTLAEDAPVSLRMENSSTRGDKTLAEAGGEIIVVILPDGSIVIVVVLM